MATGRFKYIKLKDILEIFRFLIVLPVALIGKIFIHDFWLVGEEKHEARDNGYWFFKYVRENHPTQKIAYVIDKNCEDYKKVELLGKTVSWGGWKHWFWYLVAKKNISSQKGCKPNAAVCYLFEVKLRILHTKRYFLQHGITKDDCDWLYYDVCKFKLFVCGAKKEYEFVKSKFGYPDKAVRYLGFCRFDNLLDCDYKSNQILIMPTWRSYLVRTHIGVSDDTLVKDFTDSVYFSKWADLLISAELNDILEKNDLTVLFYPHRNMQRFLPCFNNLNLSSRIQIADPIKVDVQTAMKESTCLITDYSSVFFDFAYMKKPVIFFQFDEEEYRTNQYKEGYFDYHDNTIGEWSDNKDDLLKILVMNVNNGFHAKENIIEYFEMRDQNNSKRNYEAVKGL